MTTFETALPSDLPPDGSSDRPEPSVIGRIVDAGVVVAVDTTVDAPDAELFPEEEPAVDRAVDKRRLEYTTARVCARRAMAALGVPPAPIVPGPRGEPQWPAGIVGSMTHCLGYRGAVLGRGSEVTTIGIDAEPNGGLGPGVLDVVSLPAEREWIDEFSRTHPQVSWDRLLFSAKEAVYKAWFPLAKRWLDFEEAMITVDREQGTFDARLLVPGPQVHGAELTGFSGRWLATEHLVLTAIVLPQR